MNKIFYLSAIFLVISLINSATSNCYANELAKETNLTIYSSAGGQNLQNFIHQGQYANATAIPGYGIIREQRKINLDKKFNEFRFLNVAEFIDPTTVTFKSLTSPKDTKVLEQSFLFDLVSREKLLGKYIDQGITLEKYLNNGKVEVVEGTLLSTKGGLLLRRNDGSLWTGSYHDIKFPEIPGGLITKPTLMWLVEANKPGSHLVETSYETKGISWWSDYNIIYKDGKDENSGFIDIGAWVSIINQTGKNFVDTGIKLIAGDVHRAPVRPSVYMAKSAVFDSVSVKQEAGFSEKSFFEYHLYTLGRKTSLPNNSTKQIELFKQATEVPVEKLLVYSGADVDYYGGIYTDQSFGKQNMNRKIYVYLKFQNQKDYGLGIPLPAGRIRVNKLDEADNTLEFIGEDRIDHTPRNQDVTIKIGNAFDVVGERTQVDYKLNDRLNTIYETFEIKISNSKDKPVKLIVNERLYRATNWEIISKTDNFKKIDANTIHFPVSIPAEGEKIVKYTVKYWW